LLIAPHSSGFGGDRHNRPHGVGVSAFIMSSRFSIFGYLRCAVHHPPAAASSVWEGAKNCSS